MANFDSVEDGAKVIQTALDAFGTVDVVVNNAGIIRDAAFHKMTEDEWDLVVRVHLKGAAEVTRAAWPIMRDKRYGRVIMTTSAAGIYGNFGQANYSAAKLGMYGLANTLAEEGFTKNIFVNTIAPVAASRMTQSLLTEEQFNKIKPEWVSPLVGWLAHERCTETKGLFEVGAGYVAKLRWERTRGRKFSTNAPFTPDDVEQQWVDITDFSDAQHPTSLADTTKIMFE